MMVSIDAQGDYVLRKYRLNWRHYEWTVMNIEFSFRSVDLFSG